MQTSLPIVGACRFSFLGIGDWKSYHSGRKGRTNDEIIADVRKKLFSAGRLKQRFSTFEKLTLPSLAGQTDKDFKFIVLTSDELPDQYLSRLRKLEDKYSFLKLVVSGPGRAVEKINEVYGDMGYAVRDILQFRLDDDDAVGRNYIKRVRQLGNGFHSLDKGRGFSVTFPNVLMAANVNGEILFKKRHFPNTAAGQVLYHPSKNIYDWAHHIIDRRVMVVSEWYDQWVLQSFLAKNNDSGVMSENFLNTRAEDISSEDVILLMNKQFRFAKPDLEWWRTMTR